jgi:hypothetical protein
MRHRYALAALIGAAVALTGALWHPGSAPAQSAKAPSQMSTTFERFRFSFFEDPTSAQDGLDTASLARLEGAERNRAEDMLLAYLPDYRGVIGLGVLHSRRAEPELTLLLQRELKERSAAKSRAPGSWSALFLTGLARALWQIRPDPRWVAVMVDVLGAAAEPSDRQDAAEALYEVRDPAAVGALTKALDDSQPLVRHHAARSLLAIYGLPTPPLDLQHMIYRIAAADATSRERAKQDILTAIAGRPMPAP